ncbi:response regulator transcription factor [Roseibium marinum]|nr:response regulator transcription factor [Roseibium marinum]
MLVEDDVALRESMADCLVLLGHTVAEAGSAVELYQLMADKSFDVVVVDINLPHYDGYSITRYLSDQADTGIIITTVRASLEDRVRGYQSGADIYMTKPVEPEELSAAISGLVLKRCVSRTAPIPGTDTATTGEMPGWSYSSTNLELTSPNGRSVRLTRREAMFVDHVVHSRDIVISRGDIIATLGDDTSASSYRKLDSMLCRLRAKTLSHTDLSLPISTVQGVGFSMIAVIAGRG